mgnify:CR=1 FL=1
MPKNKLMEQKRLKYYKYKRANIEKDFTLEDYLTEEELEQIEDMLI